MTARPTPDMGFTPGPWHICAVGNIWSADTKVADTRDPRAAPQYRQTSDDEKAANARLIAAAPEMFEALEIAAGMIGGPDSFDGIEPEDTVEHTIRVPMWAVQQFRAALAKARGES